jgi:hypothetical protein
VCLLFVKENLQSIRSIRSDFKTTVLKGRVATPGFAVFKYDNTVHDVRQVNATSYANCTRMDPIKSYTSGNDSVPINATTTYFMCSTPYHCEAGQKMAVTATPSNASSTTPPSPPPPPPPSSEAFRHASTSTTAATVFAALIVLFSTWGLVDV